jgi:hypothetical protein
MKYVLTDEQHTVLLRAHMVIRGICTIASRYSFLHATPHIVHSVTAQLVLFVAEKLYGAVLAPQ